MMMSKEGKAANREATPTKRSRTGVPNTSKEDLQKSSSVSAFTTYRLDLVTLTRTLPTLSLIGTRPRPPMTMRPIQHSEHAVRTITRRPNLSASSAPPTMTTSLIELRNPYVQPGSDRYQRVIQLT